VEGEGGDNVDNMLGVWMYICGSLVEEKGQILAFFSFSAPSHGWRG
jgi:hypothetical protein